MSLIWTLRDTGAHIASPSYCYDFVRFLDRIYASCHFGIPYTEDDGVIWTMTNLRPNGTNYFCYRLTVHNGRLFASGNRTVTDNYSSICYYTDNGIDWTTKVVSNSRSFPIANNFYSAGNRLFLMHGANITFATAGRYYYTDDNGVNWSPVAHTLRTSNSMAEYDNKFYIGGNYNNSYYRNKVVYSTDPINPSWVVAVDGLSVVNSTTIRCLKKFDGNLYCCDSRGSVYKLVTSTSWTEVFSDLTSCWHMDVFNEKLYVCGTSATLGTSSVYSTEDGITWTAEGITSYDDTVYGIWGDTTDNLLWAGTVDSKAWVAPGPIAQIAPPENVSATANNRYIDVSWDSVETAISYNIYWSTSSGITKEDSKITDVTSIYPHGGLTPGVTYYYCVVAYDGSEESDLSSEVSATPYDEYSGRLDDGGGNILYIRSNTYEERDVDYDAYARSTNATLKAYDIQRKKRHLIGVKNMTAANKDILKILYDLRTTLNYYFKYSDGASAITARLIGDFNLHVPTNSSHSFLDEIYQGTILLEEI